MRGEGVERDGEGGGVQLKGEMGSRGRGTSGGFMSDGGRAVSARRAQAASGLCGDVRAERCAVGRSVVWWVEWKGAEKENK